MKRSNPNRSNPNPRMFKWSDEHIRISEQRWNYRPARITDKTTLRSKFPGKTVKNSASKPPTSSYNDNNNKPPTTLSICVCRLCTSSAVF